MSSVLLEVKALTKHYEGGRIEALRGVDLAVNGGEFLAISGASGSGKSTLLQLLGGLDSPTSGEILFRGTPLSEATNRRGSVDLDTYRAQSVGFIFQAFHLLPSLNVQENVQVPMLGGSRRKAGENVRQRAEKARALLVEMGLEHRLNQLPEQLSAGERQRVAIARSLANDPEILLADEPTGNLDSINSRKIMEILAGIQERRGMTLIVVTHDDSIAASAPHHVRMRDGQVCA